MRERIEEAAIWAFCGGTVFAQIYTYVSMAMHLWGN